MNADEIIKTLKWLAKDTEFIFAAESLMTAADLIESLLAQLDAAIAGQEKLAESQCRERAAGK